MLLCKHCGSEDNVVKNGNIKGKQRYLCKSCYRTFRVGDNRERYSLEQRMRVVKLYTEGVGIRAISRLENISGAIIVHWIRSFGKLLRCKLCETYIRKRKFVGILRV